MKCEELESAIVDYLDNTLDDAHRKEIENHISSCERCMDEIRELQSVLQSISATEMEKPDETLRINFYHMLKSEMNKLKAEDERIEKRQSITLWPSLFLKIAAGIALLFAGAFLDKIIHHNPTISNSSAHLDELRSEVKDMKKMLMFTLLNEESPSQRIKAVNFVDNIPTPDQKVLNALIGTLNNDKNVNVRLAAAYSLAKFLDNPLVSDSIVESLGKQTEPIIQVVLMNILTEKKEIKAVEPMKKIISNRKTMEQVKYAAQKSINVLL